MEILLIHKGRKKVLYRLIHARKNASNSTKKSFNAYAALAMESSSSMDCGGEIRVQMLIQVMDHQGI